MFTSPFRWISVVAALALLAGCGATEANSPRTVTLVDTQHAPEPRLDFGSLSLRMPLDQLRSIVQGEGWQVEGTLAADAKVVLTPPATDPASRYGVVLVAGHVVQLAIDFREADERRVDARHHYAKSQIDAEGRWAMTDPQRRTLVVVSPHGMRVVALHLSSMRDQQGAQAALERYLGE
ncbi:MAG: hypothetical protein RIT45_1632 [Pseudomonadota bacterium]|jgi:hypothetical protein